MRNLILSILLVGFCTAAPARKPQIPTVCPDKDELNIAFFTDIHVTPGNRMDSAMRVAVKEVNSLPYDMVIISGDLCNMGSDKELENVKEIVSGFNKPLLITAGNHETTWSESAFATYGKLFHEQGRVAMRAGNYLFIGYQSGPYMKMAEGTIRPEDILWIEQTCLEAVKPLLPEGYETVGTVFNFLHLAATPVGQKVRVEAELTKVEKGKVLTCEVKCYDEKGKILKGTHGRAIVNKEQFFGNL